MSFLSNRFHLSCFVLVFLFCADLGWADGRFSEGELSQEDLSQEAFNALLIDRPGSDTMMLVTQWLKDESVSLTVWLDSDGDGLWSDEEKVVQNRVLEPGMNDVAIRSPSKVLSALNAEAGGSKQLVRARIVLSRSGEVESESSWVKDLQIVRPGKADSPPASSSLPGSPACEWSSGFHPTGPTDWVEVVASFDDGSGPALFIGGRFETVDGLAISGIAKWDGTAWSSVVDQEVESVWLLKVLDDGSGPTLYAAGSGLGLVRWNGTSWDVIGTGAGDLEVFDDGTGPALYRSGSTTVSKWNGVDWIPVGLPFDSFVEAIKVYDDGNGPVLYAVGYFNTVGDVSASYIAKWDGTAWGPVGQGLSPSVLGSYAGVLHVFDDGSGSALYVGGLISGAVGQSSRNIVRWDGTEWSAVGGGLFGEVQALTDYDDGSGAKLIAGGFLSGRDNISQWDGESWSELGEGADGLVRGLTTHDDGSGPTLAAVGWFSRIGQSNQSHVGFWDGTSWESPLSPNGGQGLDGVVETMLVHDDGSGPALFVGGHFTQAGSGGARYLAKWGGNGWLPLPKGPNGSVYSLLEHDDGSGRALFVGGTEFQDGDDTYRGVAKWDGSAWTYLWDDSCCFGRVRALAEFDDGSGPALYAAGDFYGDDDISDIAKWDGTSWTPLGEGIDGDPVMDLAVFDSGTGAELYAVGGFSQPFSNIAKWNGTAWTDVGGGLNGLWGTTLQVFDDGSGPALHVAGSFLNAGGQDIEGYAKWDGSTGSRPGPVSDTEVFAVDELAVLDGGEGAKLYIGGSYTSSFLATWDGSSTVLIDGLDGGPTAMARFDHDSVLNLYFGGYFSTADGSLSAHFARYTCPGFTIFHDGFESGDLSAWSSVVP